jgi:hypothetical protein
MVMKFGSMNDEEYLDQLSDYQLLEIKFCRHVDMKKMYRSESCFI